MGKSRQQKKQQLAKLQQQVADLQKEVEANKKADGNKKVHVNISVTADTQARLKRYAEYKGITVSRAISDWIWSTRFDKD